MVVREAKEEVAYGGGLIVQVDAAVLEVFRAIVYLL